jgi:hypothetical protein
LSRSDFKTTTQDFCSELLVSGGGSRVKQVLCN